LPASRAVRSRELRAGELLRELGERGERQTKGGNRKSKSPGATLIETPKLADLGVTNCPASDS